MLALGLRHPVAAHRARLPSFAWGRAERLSRSPRGPSPTSALRPSPWAEAATGTVSPAS